MNEARQRGFEFHAADFNSGLSGMQFAVAAQMYAALLSNPAALQIASTDKAVAPTLERGCGVLANIAYHAGSAFIAGHALSCGRGVERETPAEPGTNGKGELRIVTE